MAAKQALIFRFEDGVYRFAAGYSISPAYSDIQRRSQISPGPGMLVGRAAMTRRAVRIDDAWTNPLYEKKDDAKVGRHRSMLGVPLLRDGEPIGVLGLILSEAQAPQPDRNVHGSAHNRRGPHHRIAESDCLGRLAGEP